MKYTKNKLKQIDELQNNQKAQEMAENIQDKPFTQTNAPKAKIEPIETKKSRKRNFTFNFNEQLIAEVDEFLNEFGERGESKSSFVESAIKAYLAERKAHLKANLLKKIEKLKDY